MVIYDKMLIIINSYLEAFMRKVLISMALLLTTIVTLQARTQTALRRDREYPKCSIGITPTDMFVPLFYQHFFTMQFEYMLGESFALEIPLGFSIADDSRIFYGFGIRWYPMKQGVTGYYIGMDDTAIINLDYDLYVFRHSFTTGYKLCIGSFYVEPEIGCGIAYLSSSFVTRFIAGLRMGVAF